MAISALSREARTASRGGGGGRTMQLASPGVGREGGRYIRGGGGGAPSQGTVQWGSGGAWSPGGAWEQQQKHPSIARPGGAGGGGTMATNAAVGGPQLPYQPAEPAVGAAVSSARSAAAPLRQKGAQLLDPRSQYSQRLRNEVAQDIGKRSGATERYAALQASRAGFGSGASPELLEMQKDISVAGTQAQGEAMGDVMMQAPQLGAQMLSSALPIESAGIIAAGGTAGRQQRGYLTQQQMNQQGSQFQASQNQQGSQFQAGMDQRRDEMLNDQYLRELALLYSGL